MEESKPLMKSEKKDFNKLFKSLFSESEFRLTIVLVFFSSLVLNFSSTLVSIFYIKVWKVDDNLAGIFLALNCSQILFIFVPGLLIERYGIKFTYIFGTLVTIATFGLIIVIENIYLHVLLISLSFGFASTLLWGALKAGTTETTTLENRSLGFSLFNSAFNFSTIVLGLIYELVFYLNGINMTSYRIIFGVMIGLFLLNITLISVFSKLGKKTSTFNTQVKVKEILNQKRYWKTLAVIILSGIPLGGAYFPGIVLPIYMDRELGSTTGYGLFFAGYSLMLGVFSVLLSFITNFVSLYDCIVLGGMITAFGPLVFTVGDNHFAVAAYVIITAVGGSIIEPRIFDYNGLASVKGHEGFYFGIASIGYAFTSIFTGFVSGFMLEEYCPEHGHRECWKMWCGLSGFCALGILLLVMFKPCIEVRRDHEETDPYVFSRHLS
jgi:MFS family permease